MLGIRIAQVRLYRYVRVLAQASEESQSSPCDKSLIMQPVFGFCDIAHNTNLSLILTYTALLVLALIPTRAF